MSTTTLEPLPPRPKENRRSHLRRRLERLTYVRFDQDNGGILIDIGEGGLNFQGVAGLIVGESCVMKFILPGAAHPIEVQGQIAWSNSSRKGGGVRFVEVTDEVRLQIREWMSRESEPVAAVKPAVKQAAKVALDKPAPVADESVALEASAKEAFPVRVTPPVTTETVAVTTSGLDRALADAVENVAAKDASRVKQAWSSAADAGASSDRAVTAASPEGTKFPRSESVVKLKAEKSAAASADLPKPKSRLAQIVIVAASICVIAAAAVVGISRYPGGIYSLSGATAPVAASQPTSSPSAAASAPAAANMQAFKVEAVDVNNRHWTLENGNEATAPVARASDERKKDDRANGARAQRGTPAPPVDSRRLALSLPHSRPNATRQVRLDAPVVAVSAIPGTALLDPSAVAGRTPESPKPPQPDAASTQTGFRPAALTYSVQLRYPPQARRDNVTGAVRVSVLVNKDGFPSSLKVVSGDPRLAAAALEAIRQWRYNPALLNGKPVESQIVVTMNFQLK